MDYDQPLSDDELELAFQLWACRVKGAPLRVADSHLDAAAGLERRGFAHRRFHHGQLTWEFSDTGEQAMAIGGLLNANNGREN
jgi:hypothetical protein